MVVKLPLDVEYWFINVFSGSIEIFTFIGVLFITSMAAYFKMGGITYAIFLAMFAVILASMGFHTLLTLLILILAPILFWWIRRIVE